MHEFSATKGTIVGFFSPKYLSTIAVEGLHAHFINDAYNGGGHMFDFALQNGILELCKVTSIDFWPGDFAFTDRDMQDEIKKSGRFA